MEMLAANKMNLRRIFAAGWQEGESDAGEGDNRVRRGCEGRTENRGEVTSQALLLHRHWHGVDDGAVREGVVGDQGKSVG